MLPPTTHHCPMPIWDLVGSQLTEGDVISEGDYICNTSEGPTPSGWLPASGFQLGIVIPAGDLGGTLVVRPSGPVTF